LQTVAVFKFAATPGYVQPKRKKGVVSMRGLVKHPVDRARIRRMPRQFGAVDRNLVYRGLIRGLSPLEISLYLVLVCVGDLQGLSYYSDRRLGELLDAPCGMIAAARDELVRRRLVLYSHPIYQLLEVPS
jgi:hypothetical protein